MFELELIVNLIIKDYNFFFSFFNINYEYRNETYLLIKQFHELKKHRVQQNRRLKKNLVHKKRNSNGGTGNLNLFRYLKVRIISRYSVKKYIKIGICLCMNTCNNM